MTSVATLAFGRLLKTNEIAPPAENHVTRCAPAKPAVRITDDRIAVDWPAAVSDEALSSLDEYRRNDVLREARAGLRLKEAIHSDTTAEAEARRVLVKQLLEIGWIESFDDLASVLPTFEVYLQALEVHGKFHEALEAAPRTPIDLRKWSVSDYCGFTNLRFVLDFLYEMAEAEAAVVGFSLADLIERVTTRRDARARRLILPGD